MSANDYHEPGSSCPECDFGPFTRNHYFTGKLMQVGDFDTEQRFGIDKLRLHLQRLHGWGVVCGLRVKQHPNPACRTRFVCVEPGSAVDCCGHDILVREQDCLDLTQVPALQKLAAADDKDPHVLQICLRYRECPTEEVPVLFDDCGCDDTRCAPNRILESYELDVILNPAPETLSPEIPGLSWASTLSPARARAVALFAGPPGMLYAVSKDQKTVFQIETEHGSVVGTASLPAPGLTLAVSGDGSRVYAVAEAVAPAVLRQLLVLDTAGNFSLNPPVRTLDIPKSDTGAVFLAVAPDKRLLVLVGETGDLTVWPTTLDSASPAITPPAGVNLGTGLSGLVVGIDGKQAYTADPTGNKIAVLTLAAGTTSSMGTAISVLPTGFNPTALALVASTGPDLLVVVSQTSSGLALVAPGSATLLGTITLPIPPVALTVSPGGKWAYVLLQDSSKKSFIQAVDLGRLHLKLPVTLDSPVAVGLDSRQISLSATGQTLYVPFLDDGTPQRPGGIAVIDVKETDCGDILRRSIEGCPGCYDENCVVLATIAGYRVGDSFLDPTDPPTKPADDDTAKIARIDNRTGRRLLPSTQALYELIECLGARSTGATAAQGPPGLPGLNGTNGDPGKDGAKGDPGPGLVDDLVVITRLSWRHNDGRNIPRVIRRQADTREHKGFVISFSDRVKVVDTSTTPGVVVKPHPEQVFEVLVRDNPTDLRSVLMKPCLCPIKGVVIPVEPVKGPGGAEFGETSPPSRHLAFVIEENDREPLDAFFKEHQEVWVRLRGDFVVDLKTPNPRAIDAGFLRADLPTGERPRGTKLGIEGGLFESWFWMSFPPE